MPAIHAPTGSAAPTTGRAVKVFFYTILAVMAFVQVFVTFRGLSSPMAMESAQLAREIASGSGQHTRVIRPYAWRQMITNGRQASVARMPDTFQPPLPAWTLVLPFKMLPRYWEYSGTSRIYLLDRVVAMGSVFFFVCGVGFSWLASRRIFDEHIASWMVAVLIFCQPLWDVIRGGLAPGMMFCFFAMAMHGLAGALAAREEGRSANSGHALWIGLALALLAVTHEMAVWLIAGFALAWAACVKPRRLIILMLIPPTLATIAWMWRNYTLSGDPLGAGKAVLQSVLALPQDTWLQRDFSGHTPDADFVFLLRKMLASFIEQLQHLYEHMGSLVPACLFFLALLHPFRRSSTSRLGKALFLIWLLTVTGMTVTGLPGGVGDDRQLHFIFLPLFTSFGLSFLAVLWTRLRPATARSHPGFWAKNGAALSALLISALPMLSSLPNEVMIGLAARDRFAHWPPYLPDRIAALQPLTKPDEILFSDAPWAVAWYARRTTVWLPVKAEHFSLMREELKKQNGTVAGIVLTPVSTRGIETLGDIFRGEYADWATQIFRGYGSAFGVDTQAIMPEFPFKEFHPLIGQPVGDRFIAEMVFLSDRKRW